MTISSRLLANKNAQRRSVSVMAIELEEGTSALNNIPGTTGAFHVANLPPNSVVLRTMIHVLAAATATSSTLKLGTTDGGTELFPVAIDATALKVRRFPYAAFGAIDDDGLASATTADAATNGVLATLYTATGMPVIVTATVDTMTARTGKYLILIEYIEFDKTTGEYTSLTKV